MITKSLKNESEFEQAIRPHKRTKTSLILPLDTIDEVRKSGKKSQEAANSHKKYQSSIV